MTPESKYPNTRRYKGPWSFTIIARYSLLQLPAAILLALIVLGVDQFWINLPPWFIWGIVGAWVLKDAVLYPFFWRAYTPEYRDQRLSMIGRSGLAIEPINPEGYVRVQGELWKATAAAGQQPIQKGQTIFVTGIQGLRLTVVSPSEGILEHPN